MADILFLNGAFLPREALRIDPADRGLLLGDGLFETLRCSQGRAFALEEHWNRLSKGAEAIHIPLPLDYPELCRHIVRLLSLNRLDQCPAGIRITLTRGPAQRGLTVPATCTPTLLINSFALSDPPTPTVSLMLSRQVVNEHSPLTAFKTLAYLENICARQEAILEHYDDALLCNTKGHIVSASSANLFLVIDQTLHTPALSCGALPGITRQKILLLAKEQGIPVQERIIIPADLQKAQEAFITNSLLPLLPVSRFDSFHLNGPTPGTISARLQHALHKWMRISDYCSIN